MNMKMNKMAIVTLTGLMCASTSVYAAHKAKHTQRYHDYAKVTYVEPVYRTVRINRPEQECWDEERVVERAYGSDRTAGGIVGGILGGVAGHQVGKGHGKTAATIVGTMLGSRIGRDMAGDGRRIESHIDTETVCKTVNRYQEEERLQGYRVGYRYHGHEYDTFMSRHPGKKLQVRVMLDVVE
jgi:uncharacterized protein YcfJ